MSRVFSLRSPDASAMMRGVYVYNRNIMKTVKNPSML